MPLEITTEAPAGDDAVRAIVARLSRPHPRGVAIERAAILAAGVGSAAIMDWVLAHAGEPESKTPTGPSRGLHGGRGFGGSDLQASTPQRYVLSAAVVAPSQPAR